MAQSIRWILLLLLSALTLGVQSRPEGPPLSSGNFNLICNQLMPSHGGSAASGNGGYIITTNIPRSGSTGYGYTAGQTYSVTLSGSSTNTFRGFIVKAHIPGQDQMLLGQFIAQASQRTLDCDNMGAANAATVAQSNSARTNFQSMTFTWRAPSGSDGTVDFRYSVVRVYATYFVRQSAAANDPSPIPTTPQPPPGQTTIAPAIPMETTTNPQETQAPPDAQTTVPEDSASMATPPSSGGATAPVRAPGDYRLTFRDPPGCLPANCDVFVGVDTNAGDSNYLDIYLEGEADGWVAVGFSVTPNMELADVVACNRNSATNMVEALDAWNIQDYGNNVDAIQDVQTFSGTYSGGRIRCSAAKRIASDRNQDLDLDNNYYVLYGRRRGSSGANGLIPHETGAGNNPSISSATVNPVTAGGSVEAQTFPTLELLRFHGILMIVAWPLLALCGIFFASWMRPALPNGEWFQVHRAFLLASMFIGAAGFVVAFIANYPSPTTGLITLGMSNTAGTAHFAIGIIVMLLHILNPILAAFRCKPTGKYRWIFNLLHGTFIGVLAEMAALTNVSLGTYLLFRRYTPLFWVFIVYLVLNLIVFLVLLLLLTVTSCLSKDPNRKNLAPSLIKPLISSPELSEEKVTMSHLDPDSPKTQEKEEKADDTGEEKPKKKTPSKDSPIRWASFIVYMVLSTPLMVALIGLAAGLQP